MPKREPDTASLARALIRQNRELLAFIESSLPPIDENTFIPNQLQEAILAALDGKGLRTDALVSKTDSSSGQLFKNPGGLPELQEEGLVAHHPRVGYYRPDKPPPQVADALDPTRSVNGRH
jgi:hypothetical protein